MALEENGGGVTKQWVVMGAGIDHDYESDFIESDSEELSDSSESSSSEMTEKNESSSSSSSSSSYGPLYGLSDLMAQLPIKRGLSKYYNGKSESFASLASVESLQDLAKKGSSSFSCRQRMKPCKSYGGGFDGMKLSPKATIAKKPCSRSSSLSKEFEVRCKSSPIHMQQKQC